MVNQAVTSSETSTDHFLKCCTWRRANTVFVVAIAYGIALACLPMDNVIDRCNYLLFPQDSIVIIARNFAAGWLPTLTNEPLWWLLNVCLGSWMEPEHLVRAIIFFPATVLAYKVINSDSRNIIWLLLFLVVPQVIKNYIIHLRQGLAISVFISAWFMEPSWRRSLMLWSTPFIHASFFFILFLLAFTKATQKIFLTPKLRIFLFLIAGLCIAATLTYVGQMLGARQAYEYEAAVENISGLGFVFWFAMLGVFCSEGKDFIRAHVFEIGTITFYLGTYFISPVTARIFESGLLLVLLSGLRLTHWRRIIFLLMLVSYTLFSYIISLNKPLLGFGI